MFLHLTNYKKYDDISCITVVKGSGLEMFKVMFNKEFGKDFMRGVTSITMIEYSDASEEICMGLRKDLDVFLSFLEEFDVSSSSISKNVNVYFSLGHYF